MVQNIAMITGWSKILMCVKAYTSTDGRWLRTG